MEESPRASAFCIEKSSPAPQRELPQCFVSKDQIRRGVFDLDQTAKSIRLVYLQRSLPSGYPAKTDPAASPWGHFFAHISLGERHEAAPPLSPIKPLWTSSLLPTRFPEPNTHRQDPRDLQPARLPEIFHEECAARESRLRPQLAGCAYRKSNASILVM